MFIVFNLLWIFEVFVCLIILFIVLCVIIINIDCLVGFNICVNFLFLNVKLILVFFKILFILLIFLINDGNFILLIIFWILFNDLWDNLLIVNNLVFIFFILVFISL